MALGLVAFLVALGGCSAAASARNAEASPPRPSLVWVGRVPDGPLENDRWVQAVRAGELARVRAWSSGDLADEALRVLWGGRRVAWMRESLATQIRSGDLTVELGPRPFLPLIVQVAQDGSRATVRGCAERPQIFGWIEPYSFDLSVRYPAPYVYELRRDAVGNMQIHDARPMEHELDADPETGEPSLRTLPDGTELTLALCRTVQIPRGVLDPPPDVHRLLRLDPDLLHPEERGW